MQTLLNVGAAIALAGLLAGQGELHKRVTALEERSTRVEVYYPEIPPTDWCLEKVANYHGVLGLRINQDGTVQFKRDGKWITNNYIPPGCEPEEEEEK